MSNYLIELSLIHLSLIAAYWLFLRKENQYGKMRGYILGATILSLVIPLFKLPSLFQSQKVGEVISSLEAVQIESLVLTQQTSQGFDFMILILIYALISAFFLLRFLYKMFYLIKLEHECKSEHFQKFRIRRVKGINGSFTFFNWIFLSEDVQKDNHEYDVILRHEEAHVSMGHTYDLIFLELFKIAFWWLPTAWFTQKEIKKIHEYQADAYAVKNTSIDRYSSILISCTLKVNGLSLASSFHDGLIFNRLNAMKQKAKNVSPWKLGTITLLAATLFVVFACNEESRAQEVDKPENTSKASAEETFTKVESQPEFPGGKTAMFEFIGKTIKYPKEAEQKGIEGKVLVEFTVEKDGSVTEVKSLKGIGSGCDEEAVKAVSSFPKFSPGKQRGKTVRVKMVLPIMFSLSDNDSESSGALQDVKSDFNQMKVDAQFKDGSWTGTIYNAETGKAMAGVNVIEEGTNYGTVSDRDGTFKIQVSNKNNDLVLSHVGFKVSRLKAS